MEDAAIAEVIGYAAEDPDRDHFSYRRATNIARA